MSPESPNETVQAGGDVGISPGLIYFHSTFSRAVISLVDSYFTIPADRPVRALDRRVFLPELRVDPASE